MLNFALQLKADMFDFKSTQKVNFVRDPPIIIHDPCTVWVQANFLFLNKIIYSFSLYK